MKYIIYGIGTVFQKNQSLIDWTQVIALADKKTIEHPLNGVTVLHPSELKSLEYDFIIIFSDKLFQEIRQELIFCYRINPYKIISWHIYSPREVISHPFIADFFGRNIRSVLDILPAHTDHFYRNKEQISPYLTGFIGLKNTKQPLHFNEKDSLYDDVLDSVDVQRKFDIIWFHTFDFETIKKFLATGNNILLTISYREYVTLSQKTLNQCICTYDVCNYSDSYSFILYIRKKNNLPLKSVSEKQVVSYTVTHKNYFFYNDRLYQGLKIGNGNFEWNELMGNSGKNIEYLNALINECTGLYWIWKNENSNYVGLNHYRRYFLRDPLVHLGNIVTANYVEELLQRYDIILPKTEPLYDGTVIDELKYSLVEEAFQEGLDLIVNALKKHNPDYIDIFWKVMYGHNYYHYNMFMTHREIMEQYCEWLFPFLVEAAENFKADNYDVYNKRTIGFFAERMWTVWLHDKKYKIKELPVLSMMNL